MTTIDRADVCVYACTGKFGRNVARLVYELADANTTILLAGRDTAKVRAIREELLKQEQRSSIHVQAYDVAVPVENRDALIALASNTRVLANCIKVVDGQEQATACIAEACIDANTHYLDIATTLSAMAPVLSSTPSGTAKLVPGCGFDYAFFDVAVAQAEKALADIHGNATKPYNIKLVLAVRPGPLGFKWRVDSIDSYFKSERHAKQFKKAASIAPSLPEQPSVPLVSFCRPGLAWSIPWFVGRDAVRYFIFLREPHVQQVDARLALPRKLWRAVACGLYGAFLAVVFYPPIALAYYGKFRWLQWVLLKTLPILSFGFFTENVAEMTQAIHDVRAELYITLMSTDSRNGRDFEFLFHVSAPSIYLEHECAAIATLELAKDKGGTSGILTPAQALQDTDFWKRLQHLGHLQVRMETKSNRKDE